MVRDGNVNKGTITNNYIAILIYAIDLFHSFSNCFLLLLPILFDKNSNIVFLKSLSKSNFDGFFFIVFTPLEI